VIIVKFKSKIDWWFYLVIAVMVLGNVFSLLMLILGGDRLAGVIVLSIFTPINLLLIVPMWRNTYYYVGDGVLVVKCGLFTYGRIPISAITSVSPSRSLYSSAAMSFDRLEVRYVKKGYPLSILVSPVDKNAFAAALLKQNDKILVTNEKLPRTKLQKVALLSVVVVLVLTAVGVGGLFIYGEREPRVTIYDDSIRIRAMMGTRIELDDISDVVLIHQTMREIGAGRRRSGYNGMAWRGRFSVGLVYVRPNVAPTIHIVRYEGRDVFIKFRRERRTKRLFAELVTAVNR